MFDLTAHLKERQIDMDVHQVWLHDDPVEPVATFPMWNLSGQLCAYQAYRPFAHKDKRNDAKGRYYLFKGDRLCGKRSKTVSIWGLESWYFSKTLFATEGIFDAAAITCRGYSAVAVLSNDPDTSTVNWLQMVQANRPVVMVCDPGKAGYRLRRATRRHHIVNVPGEPDADLGDAPGWYVDDLVKEWT